MPARTPSPCFEWRQRLLLHYDKTTVAPLSRRQSSAPVFIQDKIVLVPRNTLRLRSISRSDLNLLMTLTLTNFVHQGVIWQYMLKCGQTCQFDLWPWVALTNLTSDLWCNHSYKPNAFFGASMINIHWNMVENVVWPRSWWPYMTLTFRGALHSYKLMTFICSHCA